MTRTLVLYQHASRPSEAAQSSDQGWLGRGGEQYNTVGVDHGTMVLRYPDAYGMPQEVADSIKEIRSEGGNENEDWELQYNEVLDWMFAHGWIRFWFAYGYAGFDLPDFGSHYTKMVRDFLLEQPGAAGGDIAFHSANPPKDTKLTYRDFVFEEQEPGRGQAFAQRAEIDKRVMVTMAHRKAQAMRYATDPEGRREFRACLNTLRRFGLSHLVEG